MENRRVLTGVLAGVLAAGLLISVAFGAYRAGERRRGGHPGGAATARWSG